MKQSSAANRLTRRDALRLGGTCIGGAWLGGALLTTGCGLDLKLAPDASFDEVLDAIHTTDLEFGSGLSNHAAMAAEALVTLGHEDRVVPFVSRYASRLEPLEPGNDRESELGDYAARADWIASFEADIEELSARAVVSREWSTLAPGWIAAGWHGVLRTAHAVRSLEREDTPARRREVAHGLAFWASRHERLPGTPGARAEANLSVLDALARVERIPADEQVEGGFISPRFVPLDDQPEFAALVEAVDTAALPVEAAITELAAAAARIFVNDGRQSIFFLHALTGTSALRLVLPLLNEAQQRAGLGFAFQCVAGALAAQGTRADLLDPVSASGRSRETLIALAGDPADPRAADEHSIKIIEAAVREDAIDPRPEFLAAADAWLGSSSG